MEIIWHLFIIDSFSCSFDGSTKVFPDPVSKRVILSATAAHFCLFNNSWIENILSGWVDNLLGEISSIRHPFFLHYKDKLTHLLATHHHVTSHAGSTLLMTILSRDFYITLCKQLVRSICRKCITCRHQAARPDEQLIGQIPPQWLTPGSVFEQLV